MTLLRLTKWQTYPLEVSNVFQSCLLLQLYRFSWHWFQKNLKFLRPKHTGRHVFHWKLKCRAWNYHSLSCNIFSWKNLLNDYQWIFSACATHAHIISCWWKIYNGKYISCTDGNHSQSWNTHFHVQHKTNTALIRRCWYFCRCIHVPGLVPGLHSASEKRRYKVTPSLIGWTQT